MRFPLLPHRGFMPAGLARAVCARFCRRSASDRISIFFARTSRNESADGARVMPTILNPAISCFINAAFGAVL